MPKLTFLWHLHQPRYRTADGKAHAPWVILHAAGEYLTLAHALKETAIPGQVLNLTPVFLEQLLAYAQSQVADPLLTALDKPAVELSPEEAAELVRWGLMLHPRQLARLPRLVTLADKVKGASSGEIKKRLSPGEITDLQVLIVLAYAAPNAKWEEEVATLLERGAGFADTDRERIIRWLRGCPQKLLNLYQHLAANQVELATSPYGHPILPLLIDTQVAAASVPAPPGGFPHFSDPQGAREHIVQALAFMKGLGFTVQGFWPPEGALSEQALDLYGQQGVKWLVTDEAILAASLGRPLSWEGGTASELTHPWQLRGKGPVLFFRERELSDFIGFKAQGFAEGEAVALFMQTLRQKAKRIEDGEGLVIALDGENPWTSYPEGGGRFLIELANRLQETNEFQLITLRERVSQEQPQRLERLHPGSWIAASFATWIGHEEKCKAWSLLRRCREAGADGGGMSWLVAQGSDWWWWFGDDNPTLLAPLYDELFRRHLVDALKAAGKDLIPELAIPIRKAETPLVIPLSRTWPSPILDGRSTTFFEWVVAQWLELGGFRLALRADGQHLWLRLDPPSGQALPLPVAVTLAVGATVLRYQLPADLPGFCAVGQILEAGLPFPAGNALLVVEASGLRAPVWGSYRLELLEVDET